MKNVYLVHGDVTLIKINELPKGLTKKTWEKGFIIERGEGAVHTHTIEDECEIYEKDGVMYLKVDSPVKINHEEHGVMVIEPGIYRKEIEREFSYEEMESRKVQD